MTIDDKRREATQPVATPERRLRSVFHLAVSLVLLTGFIWGIVEVVLWWYGPSVAGALALATDLAATTDDPDVHETLARLQADEIYTYDELLAVTQLLRATHRDLRRRRGMQLAAGLLAWAGLVLVGREVSRAIRDRRRRVVVASPMGVLYDGSFVPHALPAHSLARCPLSTLHPRPAWLENTAPLSPLAGALLECYAAAPEWPADLTDPDPAGRAPGPRQHPEARLLDHVLAVRARALAAAEAAGLSAPLAELTGLGHDLGKLVAFRPEGLRWVRASPFHSRMSAILLATLPEWQMLSQEDRDDLTLAVVFHHNSEDLHPTASPRARTLLGLLRRADHRASAAERHATPERASAPEGSDPPPVGRAVTELISVQPAPEALSARLPHVLASILPALRINQSPFDGQADRQLGTLMLLAPTLHRVLAAQLSPPDCEALGLSPDAAGAATSPAKVPVDHPSHPAIAAAFRELGWLWETWNGQAATLWQIKLGRRIWPACWLLKLEALPADVVSRWDASLWGIEVVGPAQTHRAPAINRTSVPPAAPAPSVVVAGDPEPLDLASDNWEPLVFGDGIPDVAGEHELMSDLHVEP